jgi:alpha-L-fucosidase
LGGLFQWQSCIFLYEFAIAAKLKMKPLQSAFAIEETVIQSFRVSRRNMLLGTGASIVSAAVAGAAQTSAGARPLPPPPTPDQIRRLEWWHAAKYGMFIHYGLYSIRARQEWAMEKEAIPIPDYQKLALEFNPKPGFAREWAKLAKAAGMRYMVMTTKHHEGFCNFDTKLTDYNAVQQGPKRDLVREFVEAARAEGMRVGLYYSLMDWHHPDGAKCDR